MLARWIIWNNECNDSLRRQHVWSTHRAAAIDGGLVQGFHLLILFTIGGFVLVLWSVVGHFLFTAEISLFKYYAFWDCGPVLCSLNIFLSFKFLYMFGIRHRHDCGEPASIRCSNNNTSNTNTHKSSIVSSSTGVQKRLIGQWGNG